jgi:hypothetical protein
MRRAALPLQTEVPMPISTRSLRRSGPGTGAHMSPTGWLTPGLSRTGRSVSSPPRCTSSVESAVLKLWRRSVFHDRRRPQLENGNRRMCPWQCSHGSGHYCQWQNRCHGEPGPWVLLKAERSLLEIASHPVPRSLTHAIWLLLQLFRSPIPLCPRRRLARVSLSDQSLYHFKDANGTQCPNHDWRSMYDRLAHSHLAKLCQYPQ